TRFSRDWSSDVCSSDLFLSAPVTAFATFELAFATILAGAWGTQLIDGRITVPALFPTFIAFLVIVAFVAFVPLLPFTPHLYRARSEERRVGKECRSRWS